VTSPTYPVPTTQMFIVPTDHSRRGVRTEKKTD
jgi:hypothetical protein